MRRWRRRTGRVAVAVAVAGALIVAGTGVADALFNRSVAAGTTIGTKQVFPGSHTWSAWSIQDASGGGSPVNASEPLSAGSDGRTTTTGNWGTAFATNRWYEADFANVLPDGVSVTDATFRLTFRSTSGTTCVYVEVRRRSTAAVVATRGSSASPFGCAGTTTTTLTSQITEVTTTAVADDLRVRIYGRNTSGSSAVLDEVTITGTTAVGPYVLLPVLETDAATGSASVTRWPLPTADGTTYTSANNWSNTFTTARYVEFGFAGEVPTNATVTDAVFTHTYRDQGSVSTCYWLEAYAGTTLVGTHGSAVAPYCGSGSVFNTDVIDLTGVTTPAMANSLTLKLYMRVNSGIRRVQHDAATLTVTYYVN